MTELLPVIQADRDAVQAFHRAMFANLCREIEGREGALGEDLGDAGQLVQAFARHRLAFASPVVGGEVEWPERAVRIAEALEHEVMSERNGSLWCRLCSADTGADGRGHTRTCVLFNDGDEA